MPPAPRPALTRAPVRPHPLAPAGPAEPPPTPAAEAATVMLSARIPVELRDEVRLYAVRHRMSVQALVEAAVREYPDRAGT